MQNKFRELHNKLNSIVPAHEDTGEQSSKAKIRNIQQLLGKLQQRYDEENAMYEHKVAALFENLRKVENSLKDNQNQLEVEQSSWSNRVGKMDKSIRKMMEKIAKERKESDKKIQSSLETYLIELTSFKGKANSSCSASIRELKQLEKDVEHLQREAKRESQLSKDIYKKIYVQFSTQIQQIGASLANEEHQRKQSEQQILNTIERMYNLMSSSIHEGRKSREKQERDIVDLLERVIEKLKYEIISD